ncbi:MAG: glycosyltransferase involved in cell wall biosynthesis [Cellvibrionaceae bacterium]
MNLTNKSILKIKNYLIMKYKIGFIIEQALGHITHGKNLKENMRLDPEIEAFWGLPRQPESGLMALPGIRNWTLQAGLQANSAIRKMASAGNKPDILFFHTQVTAILARKWMSQIPSVVSLDATPIQYDSLGEFYAHESGPAWLENFKFNLNQACYTRASHLVAWSEWTRESLIKDYDVNGDKITVIPPGVNVADWQSPEDSQEHSDQPLRILFVGGDLKRKGGDDLLQAFSAAKAELGNTQIELHLATRSRPQPAEGVFVYNDMQANSPELKALYHQADMFCLPTYGDCLPMVLSEAAATGLPLISTNVAAIPEIVRPGQSGILVKPGDVQAIKEAIIGLAKNPAERKRMGQTALQQTTQNFDAQANAIRLFNLLKQTVQN